MANIVVSTNPFSPQKAERFEVAGGVFTLRGWLRSQYEGFVEFATATICLVNGQAKLRKEWDEYTIAEGDVVAFVAIPQVAGLLVQVIISVVLAVAVALLMPKPGIPDQSQADSVFTLRGQHNQLKLGSPIESSYGRCRLYPAYAARPYTVFQNNDQYQFDLYCLGQGEFETEAPHFDDTPLSEFPDIEYQVYQPGEVVDMFPDNIVTSPAVSALELKGSGQEGYSADYYGPFVCSAPGTTCDLIQVDLTFPQGLYLMSDGGKQGWFEITFSVQYRQIDDTGAPIGEWTDFLGALATSGNTTTAIRWTFPQSVPVGRYEVRAKRITPKNTSTSCANTIHWDALRCFLPSTRVYPGVTVIALKARASNNLNDNVANRFNVWATRKLPIFDGTAWSAPTATRNPIWAFCDIFRATYGARLDAAFLALPTLLPMATTLAAEGRNFDFTFDQKITVWEAAKVVARSFRGAPIPSGTQVTIVRDTLKTVPTAVFTADNIKQGSFKYTINTYMPGEHDSVLVRYTSPLTWKEETVLCKLGDDEGYSPEDLQLPGITDRTQAWREGMYYRAAKKYKPDSVQFITGLEGQIPSYLDYILVNHDTPKWGRTSGLVVAIAPDKRTVTLNEPLDFAGITSPVLGLRKKDGTFAGPYAVTAGSSEREVVSATDITDDFFFDLLHEQPYFLFGSLSNYAKGVVVTNIQPAADDEVSITAIVYSDVPFLNDNANPDDPTSFADPDNGPGIPDFDCSTLQVSWVPQTDNALVSWSATPGARSFVVQSSSDGATWKHEGASHYTSLLIPALQGPFHVRVQALGRAGGSHWCQKDFEDFQPVLQAPVTGLAADSGEAFLLKGADGTVLAQIGVSWTLPSATFADSDGRIEVLYKKSADTVFKAKMLGAGATTYLISPAKEGEVIDIHVRAISHLGVKSTFATLQHTVSGKSVPPGVPTSIVLESTNIPLLNMEATDLFPAAPYYGTRVRWVAPTDSDLSHFEVKATQSDTDEAPPFYYYWHSPATMGAQVVETTVETEVVLYSSLKGYTGYVRVRSVDTSGNVSAWVRASATCDNTCSISGAISTTQNGSLLGRKSSGSGPVEHVPTDTTLAVTAAGVSVVAQKYTPAGGGAAATICFRDNAGTTERSIDGGATWQALGGGGGEDPRITESEAGAPLWNELPWPSFTNTLTIQLDSLIVALAPVLHITAEAVEVSGTAILQAYDQSGADHHLPAPSVGARPTLVANARNGLPVMRFDGVDDCLYLPTFPAMPLSDALFIVVGVPLNGTDSRHIFTIGATGGGATWSNPQRLVAHWGDSSYCWSMYGGTNGWAGLPGSRPAPWSVFRGRVLNGSELVARNEDGSATSANPTYLTTSLPGVIIGTGWANDAPMPYWAAMDVGEILVFRRGISAATLALLVDMLRAKWGA